MNMADALLPPNVRALLEMKETLLGVCRMKSRHPDAEVSLFYAREALLLQKEIAAIRERAVGQFTDKPEAAVVVGA